MTKWYLLIDNDKGEPLIPAIFDNFNNATKHAHDSIDGSVFTIYEDEPLLWDAGDHLQGERQPNGSIDWIRVPLFQDI